MDLSEGVDMRIILITIILTPAYIGAVTTVIGYRGQSVQIRCPYGSGYETHEKYLCRGTCSILSLASKDIPVQSGSAVKDERFSLDDDTAARVFTVTITDLRSEDRGRYWCVIQRTLRDLYTEIELLVETLQTTTSLRTEATRVPSSTPAQTTISLRTTSMRTSPSTPALRIRSTHVTPSTTSFLTVLSLCLTLLFSGLALGSIILYCKWRRTAHTLTDGYVLTRTQKVTRADKEGNHYESDLPSMTHIYQNLNLNTSQSDPVYQSLQFETNDSDSAYQTISTPISQSDTVCKVQNPAPINHNRLQSTTV